MPKEKAYKEKAIAEVLSLGPVYLKEHLHPHHSALTLRSSSEGLLVVNLRLHGTRQRVIQWLKACITFVISMQNVFFSFECCR